MQIERRREERRKVIEEMRTSADGARKEMQAQTEKNKLANDQRNTAQEKQRQETDIVLAALDKREKAIKQKQQDIQKMRNEIQEKTAAAIAGNSKLREQLKSVREVSRFIAFGYKETQEERKALTERNAAGQKSRSQYADEQRRIDDEQLVILDDRWKVLRMKYLDIEKMNNVIQARVAEPDRYKNMAIQRQAVWDAIDWANSEQRDLLKAQNTLFEQQMKSIEVRMNQAKEERRQTNIELDGISSKEEALLLKQQENDANLESIQLRAGSLANITDLEQHIAALHEVLNGVWSERKDIQMTRRNLRYKNTAGFDERADATMQQIRVLWQLHLAVQDKSIDVVNEREDMQKEIRALYEQEQKRYQEERQTDRLQETALQSTPMF